LGKTLSQIDFSEIDTVLADQLDRLWRAGRLPLAGPGRLTREALHRAISPMLTQWLALRASHPRPLDRQMLRLRHPERPAVVFDDLLDDLRTQANGAAPVWIELTASRIAQPAGASRVEARPDKLVGAWVRCLAAAACGHPADGILIGEGARVDLRCPPRDEATDTLLRLMQAWQEGLAGDRPLPTALRTGLAWLAGGEDKARTAYEGAEGGRSTGEVEDPCLARLFPDFDRLSSAEGFAAATLRLYSPYRQWLDTCTSVQSWGIDDESADTDED
jgi:exodeoxyribonuclease V gamma subunit